MSEMNTTFNLCKRIIELRKKKGYTQEALANKLGVTYQAVSKWENELSCPDITLLPILAEIFDVSLDDLFGRKISKINLDESDCIDNKTTKCSTTSNLELPWEDDDTLRIVLFKGQNYMPIKDNNIIDQIREIKFIYQGDAINITSEFSVVCDHSDISGTISAKGNITCGDVGGYADAGANINCADIDGPAKAGNTINCSDINGDVTVGANIYCADIEGNVKAGNHITCGDINGTVTCQGTIQCNSINES